MSQFHFKPGTCPLLQHAIEGAFLTNKRVRIWLGDPETGEVWDEEFDVIGKIGRSCGDQQVPLLIHNSRSTCGRAILVDRILQMKDTKTGAVLYKHENMKTLEYTTKSADELGYDVYNDRTKTLVARFKTYEKANRYEGFMRGSRFSK